MKRNCQEKFVVLDKMAAVAQVGHMTNEYSKYKAIHVLYVHPGVPAKIIYACCMLLLCAPALCSLLLQQGNTNICESTRFVMLRNLALIVINCVLKMSDVNRAINTPRILPGDS